MRSILFIIVISLASCAKQGAPTMKFNIMDSYYSVDGSESVMRFHQGVLWFSNSDTSWYDGLSSRPVSYDGETLTIRTHSSSGGNGFDYDLKYDVVEHIEYIKLKRIGNTSLVDTISLILTEL